MMEKIVFHIRIQQDKSLLNIENFVLGFFSQASVIDVSSYHLQFGVLPFCFVDSNRLFDFRSL